MRRLVTFFIFLLPYIGLAQSGTRVAMFNKLGRDAGLRNDSLIAAANFEKALALDSLNQVARNGYALTHRNAKAYDLLTEMIDREPDDTSLHIVRAYCALTLEKTHKKAGDFTQANIWFGHTIADYQWLIENGSNVNLTQAHMDEAEAIWNGSYSPVKAAVANQSPVKQQNKPGKTSPAVQHSRSLIGRSVPDAGLNQFLMDKLGYTPNATPYTVNLGAGESLSRYKFAMAQTTGGAKATVTVSYYLHSNGLIEKIDISGDGQALEPFFINYWPAATAQQTIKQQRVINYNTANEKITYSTRNSGQANISIKKL